MMMLISLLGILSITKFQLMVSENVSYEYMGCYSKTARDEFQINPGTYLREKLIPEVCVDACISLKNPLVTHSAISSDICMCALNLTIEDHEHYNNFESCEDTPCPGDPTIGCSATSHDPHSIKFYVYKINSLFLKSLSVQYGGMFDVEESGYLELTNAELTITPSFITNPPSAMNDVETYANLYYQDKLLTPFYSVNLKESSVPVTIALPHPGKFILTVGACLAGNRKETSVIVKYNSYVNKHVLNDITVNCLSKYSLLRHIFACELTVWNQNKDYSVKNENYQNLYINYGSNISSFMSETSNILIGKISHFTFGPHLLRANDETGTSVNVQLLLGNILIDRSCYLVNAIVSGIVDSLKIVRPIFAEACNCKPDEIFCASTTTCISNAESDQCYFDNVVKKEFQENAKYKIVHELDTTEINNLKATGNEFQNVNNAVSFMLLPGDRIVATHNGLIHFADQSTLKYGFFDDLLVTIDGEEVTIDETTGSPPLAIGIVTAIPSGAFMAYEYSSLGTFQINSTLERNNSDVVELSASVICVRKISNFNVSIDPLMSTDDFHLNPITGELFAKSRTLLKFDIFHEKNETENNVIYEVTVDDFKSNHSINSFNYSFQTKGSHFVEVRAINEADQVIQILPVMVIDPVRNITISLLNGNTATKNSITYIEVSLEGESYECEIWYDYKNVNTANDIVYNYSVFPSGSMLQTSYHELGDYKIKIKCYNFLSMEQIETIIHVQERITALKFGKLRYYFGESYGITASVLTGAPIEVELHIYDMFKGGSNDTELMEVNGYQLWTIMRSSVLVKQSLQITLKLCNNLGCVSKQDILLIDYNILPPTITTNIPDDNKLELEDSVTIDVKMVDGEVNPSDVYMGFDFGNGIFLESNLTRKSNVIGHKETFIYDKIAGNLEITLYVINLVNEYRQSYKIRVISPFAEKFELKSVSNPIFYQLTGAFVKIFLNPKDPADAHFGQPADGRCWWGDNTMTPLSVGSNTNYVDMSKQKIVSHSYGLPFPYVVKCEVGNELGFVNLSTTVEVRQAVVGLEARIEDVLVGKVSEIKVTALRGPPIEDTILKFYVDSNLISTKQRENEYFEEFDVFQHTFSSIGITEITIEAVDVKINHVISTKNTLVIRANIQSSNFQLNLLPPQTAEQPYTHMAIIYNFKLNYISTSISPSTNPVDDTKQLAIKMFVNETRENLITSKSPFINFIGDGSSDEEFILDLSLFVRPLIIRLPGTFTVVIQLSNGAKTIDVEKIISLYVQPFFEPEPLEILFKPKLPVDAKPCSGYGINKNIVPINSMVHIIPKVVGGTVNSYELLIDGTEVGERVIDPSKIYYTLPNAGEPKLSLKINYATTNFKISTTKLISVMKSLTSAS
ncbi:hypothetical protein SNEBB_001146, partial [Seison nebaliae]